MGVHEVLEDYTAEGSLHLLILALCLAVRLQVKSRGQVHLGSNQGAELPKTRGELGPTIRQHGHRETMQVEDVSEDELGHFFG